MSIPVWMEADAVAWGTITTWFSNGTAHCENIVGHRVPLANQCVVRVYNSSEEMRSETGMSERIVDAIASWPRYEFDVYDKDVQWSLTFDDNIKWCSVLVAAHENSRMERILSGTKT